MKITKRKFIQYSAMGGVAVGAAVYSGTRMYFSAENVLIENLLKRKFPNVIFDPAGIQKLKHDFLVTWSDANSWYHYFLKRYELLSKIGVDPKRFLPSAVVERFERRVITAVLTGSNYFYIDPENEVVQYTAVPEACPNPFIRYAKA